MIIIKRFFQIAICIMAFVFINDIINKTLKWRSGFEYDQAFLFFCEVGTLLMCSILIVSAFFMCNPDIELFKKKKEKERQIKEDEQYLRSEIAKKQRMIDVLNNENKTDRERHQELVRKLSTQIEGFKIVLEAERRIRKNQGGDNSSTN